MQEWDTAVRSTANTAIQRLSQVPVAFDSTRTTGLAIVPGVLARWLESFGVEGTFLQVSSNSNSRRTARAVADARPSDGTELLRTIITLWERHSVRPDTKPPFSQLESVIQAAQGIHAGA